jgi:lipopolysaccharide O-acetyltransferase
MRGTQIGRGETLKERSRQLGGQYLETYGFFGLIWLVLDVVRTRITFPGCRLIRFPAYVRGKRSIRFGKNLSTGRGLRIDAFSGLDSSKSLITIGSNVSINDYVHIGAIESISIGDRVLIASHVFITDHNHGCYGNYGINSDPSVPPDARPLCSSPVVIEDDVWIGEYVSVLPGVRIGKGSIVGSMTVVTHDIAPYSIAVGSPARVVKRYNFQTAKWEKA